MSSAVVSASEEQGSGALFSDRTDDTDKTMTGLAYCGIPAIFNFVFSKGVGVNSVHFDEKSV